MKKLNLLIVLLTVFACDKSSKELTGFGGFEIDSNFSSHEKFADFKNTMPDEYYCNSLELSTDIGKVSDINITTENGKIIDVKFSSNENTNIDDIQKQFSTFKESGINTKVENDIAIFNTYSSKKGNTFFFDIEYKNKVMKNGKPKHEFRYSNKKAIEDGNKLIRSMSSNNR